MSSEIFVNEKSPASGEEAGDSGSVGITAGDQAGGRAIPDDVSGFCHHGGVQIMAVDQTLLELVRRGSFFLCQFEAAGHGGDGAVAGTGQGGSPVCKAENVL